MSVIGRLMNGGDALLEKTMLLKGIEDRLPVARAGMGPGGHLGLHARQGVRRDQGQFQIGMRG